MRAASGALIAFIAACLPCLAQSTGAAKGGDLIPPNDPRIAVMGRVDATTPTRLRMGYPGVTFRLRFEGSTLSMRAAASTPNCYVSIIVDGADPRVLRLPQEEVDVVLAEGLSPGEHTVEVIHRTETWVGVVTILGFRLAPEGRLLVPHPWPRRRMLFIGDSVTCGEAIERPPDWKKDRPASWNPYLSYGMLLARTFDAQAHLVCFGGRGLLRDWLGRRDVLNAPQFFDLAVPDEKDPPAWDHSAYIPDVVFVSLGTNDFSLGIGGFPARDEWVAAYVHLVRAIRARYPLAHIFLTEGAIVNDIADPTRPQKTVLRAYLAESASRLADSKVHVLESQHYPGDASDAHPTGPQHAAMARDLEPLIRAAVGW
jgi:lysophospholipase L1-like esterase